MIDIIILLACVAALIATLPFLAPTLAIHFAASGSISELLSVTAILLLISAIADLIWKKYKKFKADRKIDEEPAKMIKPPSQDIKEMLDWLEK